MKDQQIEVKEKIIGEREEIIATLTRQLEDKTRLMEDMNTQGSTGDDSEVSAVIIDGFSLKFCVSKLLYCACKVSFVFIASEIFNGF